MPQAIQPAVYERRPLRGSLVHFVYLVYLVYFV